MRGAKHGGRSVTIANNDRRRRVLHRAREALIFLDYYGMPRDPLPDLPVRNQGRELRAHFWMMRLLYLTRVTLSTTFCGRESRHRGSPPSPSASAKNSGGGRLLRHVLIVSSAKAAARARH